jgi:hypothetical protein
MGFQSCARMHAILSRKSSLFILPGNPRTKIWTSSNLAMKAHCLSCSNTKSGATTWRAWVAVADGVVARAMTTMMARSTLPTKSNRRTKQADQLDKRLQFEQTFCDELEQIDELNNLAGSDLGDAFGFTGANGRAVLSQLKKKLLPVPKSGSTPICGLESRLHGRKSGSKWRRRNRQSHGRQGGRVGCKRRHLQAVLPVARPVLLAPLHPACPNTFWA